MKPLLVEILESILRTDGNLAYTIDCEDAVDEARIEIWENQNDEYIGFIYWTNFNDGVERASDYSVVLDEKYGLNKTLDDWEKKYELL
mgnify:CR=1 FL=1